MSWQNYIDDSLLGTGQVSKAAIAAHDGVLWASSSGFVPNQQELEKVVKVIESNVPESIYLCGEKFVTLRVDGNTGILYARKGAEGATCCKTKQAVIVGCYSEGMQAGSCNSVVEGLGDFLVSRGF